VSFACLTCQSPVEVTYRSCPACGDAISDFLRQYGERPLAGSYRLLARLGHGGMGEVYKAHHLFLDTTRVIKVMRASLTADERLCARFVREAQIAQRIDSRHLARLYEFAPFADSAFFMVWEFIDGRNLRELMRERPVPPRRAVGIVLQVLAGLEDIHAAGVIHRDISPDNVMVRTDEHGADVVKIIDLGIAKDRAGDASLTQTGTFLGKLRYSSPEQLGFLGGAHAVDHRSDLYAVGVMLYELLAGCPPFEAATPQELLSLHLNGRPRAFLDAGAGRGLLALQEIVLRALAKDPRERWASASELRRALADLLPLLGDKPVPLARSFTTPQLELTEAMPVARPFGATMAVMPPRFGLPQRRRLLTAAIALAGIVIGLICGMALHGLF